MFITTQWRKALLSEIKQDSSAIRKTEYSWKEVKTFVFPRRRFLYTSNWVESYTYFPLFLFLTYSYIYPTSMFSFFFHFTFLSFYCLALPLSFSLSIYNYSNFKNLFQCFLMNVLLTFWVNKCCEDYHVCFRYLAASLRSTH